MNRCDELPITKTLQKWTSTDRFVIQFSGFEDVTGLFKEMKLQKSLKYIYKFLKIMWRKDFSSVN